MKKSKRRAAGAEGRKRTYPLLGFQHCYNGLRNNIQICFQHGKGWDMQLAEDEADAVWQLHELLRNGYPTRLFLVKRGDPLFDLPAEELEQRLREAFPREKVQSSVAA